MKMYTRQLTVYGQWLTFWLITRRSLKAEERKTSPATINTRGYFHRKIKEKENQKKSSGVSLPAYLLVTWNLSDSSTFLRQTVNFFPKQLRRLAPIFQGLFPSCLMLCNFGCSVCTEKPYETTCLSSIDNWFHHRFRSNRIAMTWWLGIFSPSSNILLESSSVLIFFGDISTEFCYQIIQS